MPEKSPTEKLMAGLIGKESAAYPETPLHLLANRLVPLVGYLRRQHSQDIYESQKCAGFLAARAKKYGFDSVTELRAGIVALYKLLKEEMPNDEWRVYNLDKFADLINNQ